MQQIIFICASVYAADILETNIKIKNLKKIYKSEI